MPVGRHARASDRTHSPAARTAQRPAGPDYWRRCTPGRGTRDQLPGGPAGSQRCQCAAGARAWCEARRRQRRSLHTRVQHAGVGRHRGTPRLGDIGRRPQYAAPRSVAGIVAPPPDARDTRRRLMKFLPMVDRLGEIRRLYFVTTRATIEADFEKALELLKGMESQEERSRATVFMHGLAQMKADWGPGGPGKPKRPRKNAGRQ